MSVKIICPQCHSGFTKSKDHWKCESCGYQVTLYNGVPTFTDAPADLTVSEKIDRSAEQGSIWRQFNWKFLEKNASRLPSDAEVLDVGAGRGDFKAIFKAFSYTGLDIYPYPELDLAVDLITTCPFQEGSFDLVLLANVIEHVYDYRALVKRCSFLLKHGGRLLVTVPFLLKLHQEPVDYHRYTRYTLADLATENDLAVETLDAYTNPLALWDEGIGNVWQFGISRVNGLNRLVAKTGVWFAQRTSNYLKKSMGNGRISPAEDEANPNVLGYQCLFRKP
jgi:SAM-dependent methyltransferase